MHYYQHHIGDFIKNTANLNDHQMATYLRMLWSYYDSEKPISGDLEDIAFAMRTDEKTVRLLLRHFFNEQPDGWHHTRCDKEIAEYKSRSEKAAKSASARWRNTNALPSDSERKATEQHSDANQEPITNNQEKKKTGRASAAAPVERPDDVTDQTWGDWLTLRKKKGAPVTQTVLNGARTECAKAGMTLEDFLALWCTRGSQGLQADWIKPEERRRPASKFSAAAATIFGESRQPETFDA